MRSTLPAVPLALILACGGGSDPPPQTPQQSVQAQIDARAKADADQRATATAQAQQDSQQILARAQAQQQQATDQRSQMLRLMQVRSEVSRAGNLCADIAALDQKATAESSPEAAEIYRKGAADRRTNNVQSAREKIRAAYEAATSSLTEDAFAKASQPDGSCDGSTAYPFADCVTGPNPAQRLADAHAQTEALKCYLNDEQIAGVVKLADLLGQRLAQLTQKETACRNTPDCLGGRALTVACAWDATSVEIKKGIAKERANPGGVVDLRKLHDWGEQSQNADDQAKTMRAYYKSVTKKNPPACPR